ncbi:fimbrial protein [Pseudomonas atacamensis]|uniref:fimbrial protein n=1 Tax=Pseudomonas atacamensis TaxID=2565368 RepID=UPI0038101646
MDYKLPPSMTVPANTPNGTIIYIGGSGVPQKLNNKFNCTTAFSVGTMDARGQNAISGTYPIGDTGLAWEWTYNNKRVGQYPASTLPAGGVWYFDDTIQGFNIVKVGDIKAGARIPGGILGYYRDGELYPITLSVTEMNVVAASCETPDITVRMGTFTLSDIGKAQGSHSEPVAFGIKLNNCPAGLNKINYRFTRVGETADYRNGVIRLNSSSTAKGIGIQIKHSNGQPAIIDGTTKQIYDGYDSKGGNFEIPMTAAYFHIDNEDLKPGTANAELNFTIEYL